MLFQTDLIGEGEWDEGEESDMCGDLIVKSLEGSKDHL